MLRMALALAVVAQHYIACASFAQTEAPPERQAVIEGVCGQIMGLWSGHLYYPRCAENGTSMLDVKVKGARLAAAYRDCREKELAEPALSACMLESSAQGALPKPIRIAYPGGPATEPGRRFDDSSSAVQAARERYACTQLGFAPGSNPFEDCVYSLHDAVLPNRW